ncbi:hypothetical protein GQ457_13G023330 [Hibiscus cannabinus]
MLTVLSGIGGAAVTLHWLGIHLKRIMAVETSEVKKKILQNWLRGTDLLICNSNMKGTDENTLPGSDFSMFTEFVRVLQRARSMMQRRSGSRSPAANIQV